MRVRAQKSCSGCRVTIVRGSNSKDSMRRDREGGGGEGILNRKNEKGGQDVGLQQGDPVRAVQ